jgi:hypothetical protein
MGSDAEMSREPDVLARGKRFHQQVQAAYVAGLLGVKLAEVAERPIVQLSGRRERADILLLVSEAPERQRFVLEIKSTDWSVPERSKAVRRRLFRRHLNQLQGYLDVLLGDLGIEVDAVVAALLYPRRPAEPVVQELEALALAQGIMLVFYDDMDWRVGSE